MDERIKKQLEIEKIENAISMKSRVIPDNELEPQGTGGVNKWIHRSTAEGRADAMINWRWRQGFRIAGEEEREEISVSREKKRLLIGRNMVNSFALLSLQKRGFGLWFDKKRMALKEGLI